MKGHELMFGDSFESAVQHIVGQAYKVNTPPAYETAAAKLSGIQTFLIFITPEGSQGIYTDALLRLTNEISRLYSAADMGGL